jgi:imidazolonepropionase-like amidohydrolase
LSTCEILGIADKYGSLEVGKSATLFVSQGNALDMRTNKVTLIMRDGVTVPLVNFQEDLYLKYNKKYEKN